MREQEDSLRSDHSEDLNHLLVLGVQTVSGGLRAPIAPTPERNQSIPCHTDREVMRNYPQAQVIALLSGNFRFLFGVCAFS
jgi:hypothetical protein